MRSATFLLNKHPYGQRAGDTRVSRLLIDVVSEQLSVRGVALWSGPPASAPIDLTCLPKPPVRALPLIARSLTRGRSLIHSRYVTAELVREIANDPAEIVIAEHTYMAEAALAAGRSGSGLLIDTHVLESSVLAARASLSPALAPLRLEARRTLRDELRCVRAAGATACLGESDLATLRAAGVGGLSRLDIVLPPLERAPRAGPPMALFVGDRTWAPNARAARTLLEAWSRISARVPEAELVIAGRPRWGERAPTQPGVHWLGFVDDLEELFSRATLLLAPLSIGGGVRVKILEAGARGIPVVTTLVGAGSIPNYLPLEPVSDTDELVERTIGLLRDPVGARAAGEELYEANRELWQGGLLHRGVEAWLARGAGGDRQGAAPPPSAAPS